MNLGISSCFGPFVFSVWFQMNAWLRTSQSSFDGRPLAEVSIFWKASGQTVAKDPQGIEEACTTVDVAVEESDAS